MTGKRAPGLVLWTTLLALRGASPLAAQVKNPDTFTHLTIGDVDSLDPAWSYDTASRLVIANVYEYLFAYKGSSLAELEPRLASAVPSRKNGLISADGKTYAIPIRKGVKFQDGSPLTPEDVKYSLLRFMLFDRDGGPSALLLEPVLGTLSTRDPSGRLIPEMFQRADEAIRSEGDKVVIRLKQPFVPFLSILAGFGAIVSKPWCAGLGAWDGAEAAWAKQNNPSKESSPLMKRMNGTGPFSLERWDQRTKEAVLARHDGYWRGPARLKRVIVKVIDEFATRKLMLQGGDADTIYAPQMMFPQLRNLPGVQVMDGLQNLERSAMLFFNFAVNPSANPDIGSGKLDGNGIPTDFFADKNVREGFAYSIDYDSYIRDILRGKGRQATGVIPRGLVGYNPKGRVRRFDPAKARERFQRASSGRVWERGFKFTILFNTGSLPAQTIAGMLKKNVEALNPKFKIDARPVQWSTFLDLENNHKIPLYLGAWQADYPDPHNFAYPLLHSSGYQPKKQGYKNPEIDRLIEAAARESDPARREKAYFRMQDLAFEEVPHVQIAEGVRYRTQRSWVKGWSFNPVFPEAPYGSYYYDLYKE